MRHEVDEAGDLLRVNLDVPAPWPASDGATGALDGAPEGGHHVFPHLLCPGPGEGAPPGGDPVADEVLEVVDVHSPSLLHAADRGSNLAVEIVMGTSIERNVSYAGGSHAIRIANAEVELVVATDFGPRILVYRHLDGRNILGWLDPSTQSKPTRFGEPWHIYGGHRLWHAPEDPELSYVPDNHRVPFHVEKDGTVVVGGAIEEGTSLRKEMLVRLDEEGTGVTIEHRITNAGPASIDLAAWALSVMAPGGTAFFPNAPFVPFPDALLPSSRLVLWPYTCLADPRFAFGPRYTRLRHDANAAAPQKIGLLDAHHGWAGYALDDLFFVKRFAPPSLETGHVDLGCNVEAFTDAGILELETLGPKVHLPPGGFTSHVEGWSLFDGVRIPDDDVAAEVVLSVVLAGARCPRK